MDIAVGQSPSQSVFQSRWLVAGAWLAGMIVYSALIWLTADRVTLWVNDVAWTLTPAIAALSCFRTARHIGDAGSKAWWLLGSACTSWLIGQLYWNYNQLVLEIEMPFPNSGQLFYSSFPVLSIAAIAQLRESRNTQPFTLKHLGNIALVICCLLVTVVLGLIEPAVQSGVDSRSLWITAVHCMLIATMFLYALYALWTYRWSTAWAPMLLLAIGSGIYAICNLIYVHAVLTRTYLPSDVINMSWLLVFGLVAWAAAERLWLHRHPCSPPPHRMLLRERWLEAVMPALLIVIMVIVAVSSSSVLTLRVLGWSATLFVLFAAILGMREAWIQGEAQRLTNELVSTNRQLHDANLELRDSETRYRDLNTALERRVAERTAQLERAYSELEGFSYAVAHDLKAPLRAINGFAHLLRDELGQDIDTRVESHLNRIRNGSLKMSALIDDLLAYSNIERRDLRARQVGLPAFIGSITAQYADELQRRGVRLTLDVAPITLFLDADGLSLALRNLLENALKYTRDADPPAISISASRTAGGVLLALQDNGIGFDMQYHDHIFKVFQRLHRDDQYPGTGIGLALVRKAIERIGGKVWGESTPGDGAVFYLELPQSVVTSAMGC